MKSISTLLCLVTLLTPGLAQTIDLGTALPFAAIAGKAIISTGNTKATGNIGVQGEIIEGFPPGELTNGTSMTGINKVATPLADAMAARTAALALTPDQTLTSAGSGQTLSPGVYAFAKDALLTGDLTLDGAGQYVFQTVSTFTVVTNTTVIEKGGATGDSIFWAVGGTVTIDDLVVLKGSVMTGSTITVGLDTAINGNLYAGSTIMLATNKIGLVN